MRGGCRAPSDCPAGDLCGADGACHAAQPGQPGAACASNAACTSGLCLTDLQICSLPCGQQADCPGGFSCVADPYDSTNSGLLPNAVQLVCLPSNPSGAALGAACSQSSDCADGTCNYGLCTRVCSADGQCPSGDACATQGMSVPLGAPGAFTGCLPTQGLLSWDTGIHPTTTRFQFQPPQNTASFTVLNVAPDDTHFTGDFELDAPDGTVLSSGSLDTYLQPIRYLLDNGASAELVPNTPKVALSTTGGYTVEVGDGTLSGGNVVGDFSTKPHTVVSFKLAPGGNPTSGQVPLHFYFLDLSGDPCLGGPLNASTAPADPSFQMVVQSLQTIYAQVNLSFSEITYTDVTSRPDLDTITVNSTGPSPQLNQLLELSQTSQAAGLNVFFVRSINPCGVLGVAGDVPAPGIQGTAHSGVAVSIETLCSYSWSNLGDVVAHECGHTLGLFHNVEMDYPSNPTHHDPIGDTGTDASNLMYWNEQGGGGLSPGQGFVMLRNVVVK